MSNQVIKIFIYVKVANIIIMLSKRVIISKINEESTLKRIAI